MQRVNPERRNRFPYLATAGALTLTAAGLLAWAHENLNPNDSATDAANSDYAAQVAGDINDIEGLATMPESSDEVPGLNNTRDELSLASPTEFALLLMRHRNSKNEVKDETFIGRIMSAPVVYGPRMNVSTPEELGLEFPDEVLPELQSGHDNLWSRFTPESIEAARKAGDASKLVLKENPATNETTDLSLSTYENRVFAYVQADGLYDEVDVMSLLLAYDFLKTIPAGDGTLWDELTPSERTDFAFTLIEGWDNQREEGAVRAGTSTIQYMDGDKKVALGEVGNGNGGIYACRIEAAPTSTDDREDQLLKLQRILITEQDEVTETPFSELSRNDNPWGVIVTGDIEALAQIAKDTDNSWQAVAQAILKTSGAYERMDAFTGFNSPDAPEVDSENVIPNAYEVGGLTYEVFPQEKGDNLFFIRPCGRAIPAPQPTPEAPVFMPTEVPPVETTPEHESTPEATPSEKSPIGNQTNPDGETEAPPEGGLVIIDGTIDENNNGTADEGEPEDNIGSGR